jgi:hypothetical protein
MEEDRALFSEIYDYKTKIINIIEEAFSNG